MPDHTNVVSHRPSIAAVCVTLGLNAILSCDVVVGVESLPRGTWAYADDTCSACMVQACGAEEQACLGDPACSALFTCLSACAPGDPDCRATCDQNHGDAFSLPVADALDICRRAACSESCVGSGRLWSSAFDDNSACSECIRTTCSEELAGCAANRACERSFSCARDCTDPDCVLRCIYDVAGSYRGTGTRETRICQEERCSSPCNTGDRFGCINAFDWSAGEAVGETLPYAVRVGFISPTFKPGLSATGAQVRACQGTGTACVEVASVAVDDTGFARMDLPALAFGWRGRFEMRGAVDGFPVLPLNFYIGRPLRRFEDFHGTNVTADELLELSFAAVDLTYAEGTGVIVVQPFDCLLHRARSLRIEIPEEAMGEETAVTTLNGTDVVFANVLPGNWTVHATLDDGTPFDSIEVSVVPRGFSSVYLFPHPRP